MTDTSTGLDRLTAFARQQAPRLHAEHEAQAAAERAREIEAAAAHAARAYAACFGTLGEMPPPLNWTGYPRSMDTDSFRILATAYLDHGVFLAYAPFNSRRRDGIGSFTLVGADHPDHAQRREIGAAHVADLISLAETLDLIGAHQPAADTLMPARSCAACPARLAPAAPGRAPRIYCSDACRQRGYRQRAKAKQRTA